MTHKKKERNILSDLTGGTINDETQLPDRDIQNESVTYSIYYQFDDDEPQLMHSKVPADRAFTFTFPHPGEQSYVSFTDPNTGKKMVIFTKL